MNYTENSPDDLITARRVRKRFGDVSDMTLFRWSHDSHLGFPSPIYISRRRYWKLGDLEAWERSRAAASNTEAA